MQSEAPENTQTPEDSSQSNKQRRTPDQPPESGHALPNTRRTLTTSSPQPGGSSREMTPPEGSSAIKFTRTGRVSKATKGQRVHHCEECGKTYTRAEHLRRHQQNHKPGAFPCDVPGCGRSFYREDLLIRHKARHNDPLNPLSGPPSPGSEDFAPAERISRPSSRPPAIGQGSVVAEAEIDPGNAPPPSSRAGGQQGGNTRTKERYLDLNQLNQRVGQLPVSIGADTAYPDLHFGGHQWNPSSPCSPTGYESPTNGGLNYSIGLPYFQPHLGRARHSSSSSYLGTYPMPQTSRSPVSAGSSTLNLPQWGRTAHGNSYPHLSTSSESEGSFSTAFGLHNSSMAEEHFILGSLGSSDALIPEHRDLMEQEELIVPTTVSQPSSDLSVAENTYSNEQRYLGAYWFWIHPFFPVVHRPSFNLQMASPMLKCAILALGAHALGDVTDKTNGRIMHERCTKVLKKRTINESHSFRPCDMQAVVLIEVYSIFKSRRPPLVFSKFFEEVYTLLANDPNALNANTAVGLAISSDYGGYFDQNAAALALDARIRQRLFLACYILDQHHAILFGRKRTSCFAGAGMDLPFPESQSLWDAPYQRHDSFDSAHNRVWDALDGTNLDEAGNKSYDLFQSMLMMACVCDSSAETTDYAVAAQSSHNMCESILATLERSPRIQMAYHTLQLCNSTPVRNLLAVAGESWVMAEKLSNPADYHNAQSVCKLWAQGSQSDAMDLLMAQDQEPVHRAVMHARRILELHQNHPKTGLIFQQWSLYLASVVIWARAYVTSNQPQRVPRLAIPHPTEPRLSAQELEQAVSQVVAASAASPIDLEQARSVLLWTKSKIEKVDVPNNWGLTNGVLDVLGKLAKKGTEDGWFGS